MLYLAALEAARRLPDVLPHEVAAVAEALGDVQMLLGEYQGARTAYRTARRHVPDDAVAQGRLLLKEALVNDIEGNYSNALRTLSRGRNVVEDLDQIEAARLRAQLAVHYGSTLCAQGRYEASIGWSRRALEEATTAGDKDAMAHAYYLLDVAEVSSGWSDGKFSVQALELYRELGNRTKQADVMNNLGGYAYWAGRWDEARSWYERAREVYLDTGNIVDAGFATANLGEILLAQGDLADAEKVLHEALRGFRASGVRSQVAFVQNLLAAAAARAYRFEEAEALFKEVAAAQQRRWVTRPASPRWRRCLRSRSSCRGRGRMPRRRPKRSSVPIPRIRRRLSPAGRGLRPGPDRGARGGRGAPVSCPGGRARCGA